MLNMGIPMILSMVLQACYNIVDSMFVAIMLASRIIAAGFLFARLENFSYSS